MDNKIIVSYLKDLNVLRENTDVRFVCSDPIIKLRDVFWSDIFVYYNNKEIYYVKNRFGYTGRRKITDEDRELILLSKLEQL